MGRKKRKQHIGIIQWVMGFMLICLLSYLSYHYEEIKEKIEHTINEQVTTTSGEQQRKIVDGELQMHTIDVGQGDSILICQGNKTMLIDCGTKANGSKVVQYLENLGITKIDILVGTHPHDDHMGGMATVIQNFEIGTLYALDHSEDGITTIWYQEFLDAVIEKKVNWVFPKAGDEIAMGQMVAKVLAPIEEDNDNQNNNSIVLRVSFGNTDILLTGDAEQEVEQTLLKENIELASEILKVAHHGSDTSNTKEFLENVKPQYAVISAKKGNTYGHPKKKVMELLQDRQVKVYRTDEQGSIIMKTDGNNITCNVEPGTYEPGT